MKNVLYILVIAFLILFIQSAKAAPEIIPSKVYAVVQNTLNYKSIKSNTQAELLSYQDCGFDDFIIKRGDKITVTLTEYVQPKRGKINGYYKVKLDSVNEKLCSKYNYSGTMRISEPKDLSEIAEKAGIAAAGMVLKVPGFSQGIALAKGIVSPNENETRLQSAGKNLYESTPLTYAEKGQNFYADKDSIVVLKLKKNN